MDSTILAEITNFLITHNKYIDRELLKKYVQKHEKYGTLDYAVDDRGDIVSMCRWNIIDSGTVAEILDFAIREDFRNKGVGSDFIRRAMIRWPKIEWLEFKRGVRGDERIKRLRIDNILKRSIF